MELTFLGTSSGIPTRERNVSALALRPDGGRAWFLVDCGEGTQQRVLQYGLSLVQLQAICITHIHGDHTYGLPGLLSTADMQGRQQPLTLVAPAAVQQWLQATRQWMDLDLSYELQFLPVESLASGAVHALPGWGLRAVPLSHRVPSFAYVFDEQPDDGRPARGQLDRERLLREGVAPGPLWQQLQQGQDVCFAGQQLRAADYCRPDPRPPRCLIIGGDNDQPELLRPVCSGAQLLVHEATYSEAIDSATRRRYGHSSAAEVAAFAARAGLPNLLLTHFSPRYAGAGRPGQEPARQAMMPLQIGPQITEPQAMEQQFIEQLVSKGPAGLAGQRRPSVSELEQEARAHYAGTLYLAHDGMRCRLERGGQLRLLPPAA